MTHTRNDGGPSRRFRLRTTVFWALAACALLFALAACGKQNGNEGQASSPPASASEEGGRHHTTPNGDLQVETASLDVMPDFLDGTAEQVKLAYAAAAKIRDTLQYIPCYCGCGEIAGHKDNLDCFIAAVREDGTVVWDDHGTGCGVCQLIALQSAQMKAQGRSDMEIRKYIDATYAEGYANPTDTPLPQA
ncbi:PCYCGC domain-containing protein [Cohnella sp. REN36]|uniref:PCYCGC domain-containing protein n=1 Tax=Cohnella sp. REN36 TaxID=2887347 RepID=UPI001D13C2CF|nr:PCYCGC domain-containing protein [Cohnella sp. REN36]MCC3375738.1 PCYCGC domain-containing protein [Cohnella sp. REN36]